jgi:hypothetical protein
VKHLIATLRALVGVARAAIRHPWVPKTTPVAKRPRVVYEAPPAYTGYLEALTLVDPGLTVNPERAIRRGLRVIEAFQRHEYDADKVLDYTRQEFDGGFASVDSQKAGEILTVALRWLPVAT